MASPYADLIADYGRGWQRPWLVLLSTALLCSALRWLTSDGPEAQTICTPASGSRWQAAVNVGELSWTADLDAALRCGRENGRDVLIAFHAVTDTNALMNEHEFARNRNLRAALKRHVLVMLHTDAVPAEFYQTPPEFEAQRCDGAANLAFQVKTLDTVQEPLYVVVRPAGNGKFAIVGVYDEARINDAEGFARFLRDPRHSQRNGFWETIRMHLRNLIPALFAALPLFFCGCNKGENGGGGFFGGRTPTFQFAKEEEGGCGDLSLYKATADKRDYVLVNADKDKLKLKLFDSKEFDIAAAPDDVHVRIELWSSVPKFVPYCNCVRDGSKLEATWTAKSGKVTITLGDFVDHPGDPLRRYKASAKLENVVFQDDAGRKATLKEATITDVIVGWYAG